MGSPVAASKTDPWHGQASFLPSGFTVHPSCVQTVLKQTTAVCDVRVSSPFLPFGRSTVCGSPTLSSLSAASESAAAADDPAPNHPAPSHPAPTHLAPTATDPLLAQIGSALLWVTVGWWLIVVVRLLGSLVRTGTSPTMLITNIDHWPEETVVAAVVSVLAALVLLLGRGSRGRDALDWSAGLLAVVTVAVAVWRLLP